MDLVVTILTIFLLIALGTISHEGLAMMPGEEFDVTFAEAGDYTYWCGPHKGAGMIGTVHVS